MCHQIPGHAQIATNSHALLHIHAPIGAQMAAALQPAPGKDAGARTDVLTHHQIAATAHAAPRLQRSAHVHRTIHLHATAHLYAAGKHDGICLQPVQLQHGIGGAKVVQQP
ncbi:hypothetical protein D3C72_1536920 [compost metagenome]